MAKARRIADSVVYLWCFVWGQIGLWWVLSWIWDQIRNVGRPIS